MLLSDLLSLLDFKEVINFIECEITDVTENSKEVTEESIFVIRRGAKFNGMNFLSDARDKGASVFVCENNIPIQKKESLIICENARKALADLSKLIYDKNLHNMCIIGITGTKGKTTTLKMLSECLSFFGEPLVSVSTLGVDFYGSRSKSISTDNTTPNAPFLYKILNRAYNEGIRIAVIEVSSQALADLRVYGIPFTVCIFTNISPDHIGGSEHGSFEDYFKAKRKLFSDFAPRAVIVNSFDSSWEKMTEGVGCVIKVGYKGSNFFYKTIFEGDTSVRFLLSDVLFELPMGGAYNGINASLAVVAASLILNKNISDFKESFRDISVAGRYEVFSLGGIKIIIDFAHNKSSFQAICKSAARNTEGRLILVFGSVGERCFLRRSELAEEAEKYADKVIITSDDPGNEPPEKIAVDILSNFKDRSKAEIIIDRERAILRAIDIADDKDCILLLGKGGENYQLIGDKKIPFSEREIIIRLGAKKQRPTGW